MRIEYLLLKFLHILIAILALATSAGLGIALEFYGSHPAHGPFLLRAIGRIVAFFVLPGYVLMLATGLWMVDRAWPLTTWWVQAAVVLWALGIVGLASFLVVLRRQLKVLEAEGPTSAAYQRISLLGRGLGAGVGLVVIIMLYLMVFKPAH
jgi:hypothetical protein